MRKQAKRRSCGPLPRYTLMHELAASPTQPVPESLLRECLHKLRNALKALQVEVAPTTEDWGTLSDAVNMLTSLQELGYINDDGGEIAKAKDAMGVAGERYLAGGALRLTGAGISTMHALLDDYDEVVHALSARQFIKAVRHTERRVLEVLRGKTYRGDKVIAL